MMLIACACLITIGMLCHVPCWINGMFPRGMLHLIWDCKELLDLLGPCCVYRLI